MSFYEPRVPWSRDNPGGSVKRGGAAAYPPKPCILAYEFSCRDGRALRDRVLGYWFAVIGLGGARATRLPARRLAKRTLRYAARLCRFLGEVRARRCFDYAAFRSPKFRSRFRCENPSAATTKSPAAHVPGSGTGTTSK